MNVLPMPGFEPLLLEHPARSAVTILTELCTEVTQKIVTLILQGTGSCHGGNYKVHGLLGCDAVWFHVNLPSVTKYTVFAPHCKVSHPRTLSLFLVSSAQFALGECSQQLRWFCCSVRRLALTVLSSLTKNFIGN
jgi:hypothetical protein